MLVLAVTQRHGVGISMDSVAYARAAERLLEQGKVEVAVTPWDSDARYAPLSHFPPALPIALVYWNELDRGGHFAAFEQPALFVDELRACFRLMRG
jgi:pimeloyl-ACP methyl ester carboxylesterase